MTLNTITIMSGLATRGAFDQLLPEIERTKGLKATVQWNPTTVIMKAIAAGERADIVVVTDKAIDELAAQGAVVPDSKVDLGDALLGLGVLRGKPKPDISTTDGFRQAVLAARSVAYSRAGASGIYFETLIERLKIADAVRAKATVIPAGFTAERLITGEADLAIQQISELLTVDGVEIVGPLPPELQVATRFTAAIFTGSPNAAAAASLLKLLSAPEAKSAYDATGMRAA
jgi:molybdate transport system substrate-binding protein